MGKQISTWHWQSFLAGGIRGRDKKLRGGVKKKLRGGVGWGVIFLEKSAVGQKMPKTGPNQLKTRKNGHFRA